MNRDAWIWYSRDSNDEERRDVEDGAEGTLHSDPLHPMCDFPVLLLMWYLSSGNFSSCRKFYLIRQPPRCPRMSSCLLFFLLFSSKCLDFVLCKSKQVFLSESLYWQPLGAQTFLSWQLRNFKVIRNTLCGMLRTEDTNTSEKGKLR